MSGSGETVAYTRKFAKGPKKGQLTKQQKDKLKKEIDELIDDAGFAITIEVMNYAKKGSVRKKKK